MARLVAARRQPVRSVGSARRPHGIPWLEVVESLWTSLIRRPTPVNNDNISNPLRDLV